QLPSDLPFHAKMIDIFTSLRDLHTVYALPVPYSDAHAWLPFKVEVCFEGRRRRYIVSRVVDEFVHSRFRKGVEVLSWNGVPIAQGAWRAGPQGATSAARHALGIARLTYRWLNRHLPPQEDSALIRYRSGGREYEVSVRWNVSEMPPGGLCSSGAGA